MPKNVQITVQLYSFHMLAGFLGKSAGKESACNAGDPGSIPGSGDPVEKDRLPTPVFLGFHGGSAGKEYTCNEGDLGSIPGLGRFPGEGNSYPLQYSCLENSMDCIVHEVAKSRIQLSDFHFHFLPHCRQIIWESTRAYVAWI